MLEYEIIRFGDGVLVFSETVLCLDEEDDPSANGAELLTRQFITVSLGKEKRGKRRELTADKIIQKSSFPGDLITKNLEYNLNETNTKAIMWNVVNTPRSMDVLLSAARAGSMVEVVSLAISSPDAFPPTTE